MLRSLRAHGPLFLLLMAASFGAWSHAALVKSVPGKREVLTRSPPVLQLKFNEKVEAKFSRVTLEDGEGRKSALPAPVVAAEDPYRLDVPLAAALPPGRYTVRYRVLSQDGHVIEQSFGFTLDPPGGTAAPTP